MFDKANKIIAIREVHDIDLKEKHLELRRSMVEDYDKKYEGLDRIYYDKNRFIKFAEKKGAKCIIKRPTDQAYWNNGFVFDVYISK